MRAAHRSDDRPATSGAVPPVRIGAADPAGWSSRWTAGTEGLHGEALVDAALARCADLTSTVTAPGGGHTLRRWELLATLAAADLTLARIAEAHLDAVAILGEAAASGLAPDQVPQGSTWGVFAAEAPGQVLEATETAQGWRLTGTKPWCSLAGRLSHALTTARASDGRRLFAVRLDDPGVAVRQGAWHCRGLRDVPSGPVDFDAVAAEPVGPAGWYLERPGFAYGGIGVSACWFGGAVGVARSLAVAAARREPDQLALWHLGETDLQLQVARSALRDAAAVVDGDSAGTAVVDGELLALRVRALVAAAAEAVLVRVGHALGPAPLALDEEHAGRVADLTVYLRQHHAERDVVALGRAVLQARATVPDGLPW